MDRNNNTFHFKEGSKVDPYSDNFDYAEYRRRWVSAFKHPEVYVPLAGAIIGILLALSILVWPCTTRFKIRAILAFFITYMCSQSCVRSITKYINSEGEDQK